MIYEVTQFGLPKNIAAGVTEALRQMQPGDTLHFPKGEYHFYKDYCQSLVVHTSNTDSFQRPKKTFGILSADHSAEFYHSLRLSHQCGVGGDRQARPHGQLSSAGESALLYGRRQRGLF